MDKNIDRNLIKISLKEDKIVFKTKKIEMRNYDEIEIKKDEENKDISITETPNSTSIIIIDKEKSKLLSWIIESLTK